ncbi:MAG: hypothetical protein KDE68_12800 [Rhodocyclaceae bacterium]|nr:hypothetical protein [Rhodocyclaceae bacterium]
MNPRSDPFAPATPPSPPNLLVWTLALVYLFVGLIGHDPWRGDDARHFGPVLAMLKDQHWLIPHIAGEPFLEFPPLYYWFSALVAWAFQWLLPLHDAARLGSGGLLAICLLLSAAAARRMHGSHAGAAAVLLTLGTLGLVVHAHETQPLLALMTAQAVLFYGVALSASRPSAGALIAGLGAGLAFLAHGVSGALMCAPILFLLPSPRAIGLALGAAGLTAGLWLVPAWQLEPGLLAQWWQASAADAVPHPRKLTDTQSLLGLLGWFTWPLWPIAGWALWRARRQFPRLHWRALIAGATLALLATILIGPLRPANALPVLVPLALIASAGVTTLRRGAANAFDWFAGMSFAVFALLLWLAWTSMTLAWPPGLSRHVDKVAPNFVLADPWLPTLIGAALCAAWVARLATARRSPYRGAISWAAGMTMLWCLAVVLLEPWFDHAKRYRPAVESLAAALAPESPVCLARINVSPSLRVNLDYFAQLRTQPFAGPGRRCDWVLVYGEHRPQSLDARWRARWHYHRGGGDKREDLRLYARRDAG